MQFGSHVTRNDVIIVSLPETMENADVPETNQIICHLKGHDESYPKIQVLSNLSNFVKSYRQLSENLTFITYHKHSPNMVKSRDSWC